MGTLGQDHHPMRKGRQLSWLRILKRRETKKWTWMLFLRPQPKGDNVGTILLEPLSLKPFPVLFNAFWWLQHPFSRPFVFAEPGSLKAFMRAVDIVLPVLQEANKKDRQMAGANKENATHAKSTANAGTKRRRDEDEDEEMMPVEKKPRPDGLSRAARDKLDSLYRRVADLESNAAQRQAAKVDDPPSKPVPSQMTFIKYLTSPDLLDLELSDPNFRRQFLFQLLITLHHLKTYTKDQKAAWCAGANKSLQIGGGSFTLNEGEEEGWVLEKERKCIIEMRFTGITTSTSSTTKGEGVGIDGRAFQDMVALILEREKNWVPFIPSFPE
jgi:THO complex subunit 1 transcription elongation factor